MDPDPYVYSSDDDRSVASYDLINPVASGGGERALVSRIPGKEVLEGDEVPEVLYTVNYYNNAGRLLGTRQSDKPSDHLAVNADDEGTGEDKKPVIEILTSVVVSPPAPAYYDPHRRRPRPPRDLPRPPTTVMKIRSSRLRAALSAVIGYYPGFDVIQAFYAIEAPYCVLVHRWKALEQYKLNQPACHDAEYAAATARDIDVLLSFLEEKYSEKISLESARWANPLGATATFDLFWLLLEPGEIVYREKHGQMVPFIVSGIESVPPGHGYQVYLWNIRFSKGRMERTPTKAVIHPWIGERLIHTLPVIPARFVPGGAKAMAEEQIRLGKVFWELAKQPVYKEYDGPAVHATHRKRVNVTGRVIVDCEGFERFGNGAFPPPPVPHMRRERHRRYDHKEPPLPQVQSCCTCTACSKAGLPMEPSRWVGFDDLDPQSDSLPPNEDLYFHLINPSVPAFILAERQWAFIHITHLRDVAPDQDAFKYLVLDPEVKLTVKSMIGKFASLDGKLSPWPSDFVKNKGEGRIFLLHGSPGVGKTCTAECAAELARRPLLAITSGDIGPSMDGYSVEKSLNYFLTLGERFGALVLLDEADVYLEKRKTRDLRRNGLVSIFLRALEYYKGVLFLTTNRVEAFDDAFTSRIHVALHYKHLGDEERQRIWMQHFERLERDSSQKVYVPPSARAYALESPEVHELEWNGREIRNALQTAVALAEAEALEAGLDTTVAVADRHLRAVVRMSAGFKEFLKGSKRKEKKVTVVTRRIKEDGENDETSSDVFQESSDIGDD
ncbi:AAA+ ATPase domain-containing protein [Madurella fahalii]|uniref:AAA+ ATPase domain-containing protein n=1 Tax=Madurella fahalii TaxID=1157608 RepID=A0ABQ0FZW2_9PEZI